MTLLVKSLIIEIHKLFSSITSLAYQQCQILQKQSWWLNNNKFPTQSDELLTRCDNISKTISCSKFKHHKWKICSNCWQILWQITEVQVQLYRCSQFRTHQGAQCWTYAALRKIHFKDQTFSVQAGLMTQLQPQFTKCSQCHNESCNGSPKTNHCQHLRASIIFDQTALWKIWDEIGEYNSVSSSLVYMIWKNMKTIQKHKIRLFCHQLKKSYTSNIKHSVATRQTNWVKTK